MLVISSCGSPHYGRFLSDQDSIILTNPKLVLQNLEGANPHDYTSRDEAYYNLLLTMARDKNYFQFVNDSLIYASQKWFSRSRDLYNQARSTLYLGLVRYRINSRDTTIPQLLIDARREFDMSGSLDLSVPALTESYLGAVYFNCGEWEKAGLHQRKWLDISRQRRDSGNLIAGCVDLSKTLLSAGRTDEAGQWLDSAAIILDSGNGTEYRQRYNNVMAQRFYYSGDYSSALAWAKMWVPAKGYEPRKAQLLSQIFQKQGRIDSAIIYKDIAIKNRRSDDSLFYYVHHHGLSELYAEKGDYISAYREASEAYKWLLMSNDRRAADKIAKLERENEISMHYVEKSEFIRVRLITVLLALSVLLAVSITAIFQVRSKTRRRYLEMNLKNEQMLRRITAATAIPVSGLLPDLGLLANKAFSKEMTGEDLSKNLNSFIDSVRQKQADEFKHIVEENLYSFSPALQAAMSIFKSDAYKVMLYLLEQGYSYSEISGMTGRSAANIRSVASQYRKAIDSNPFFTPEMRESLRIMRQD